jgi:hypothetical protein
VSGSYSWPTRKMNSLPIRTPTKDVPARGNRFKLMQSLQEPLWSSLSTKVSMPTERPASSLVQLAKEVNNAT